MEEKQLNKIMSRLMMRAKRHGTELIDEAHSLSEKLVAEYLMDTHDKRQELLEKLKKGGE